ncbi:MAG: type II secretion system inner membrane protein GspF [Gammaproteobacteria bacterium]|nr:type II secretion system inner membrane protein GspF [Gammaproteobacteria bacterium]MDH5729421.1 type II secretion system inner membrane protein GspF [Gammaproteobacteria bacterium]
MSAFEYVVLNDKGKETKGVIEGDTARQVRQMLREKGWTPLSVEEVHLKEQRQQKQFSLFKGVSSADLTLVTRQLSTLVGSGIPVEEALKAVSEQTDKPRMKSMIMGVRSRVLEGHTLANAFNDYPHVFDELYRSTVEAGEQSGHINIVLERLADYTESRQIMRQKLSQALIYPILVTIVAISVIVIMLAVVVPKVVTMFETTGGQLPFLTVALIAISDFIAAWGFALVILIGLGVLGFSYLMKLEGPRYRVHEIFLKLPLVSKLTRGMNTGRFTSTLAILSVSGVPVLDAMRIAGQVLVNLPMRRGVNNAAKKVREGATIFAALDAEKIFPPMTIHLIASGESSGNLEEMLERAAQNQEREVEGLLGTLISLFEPIMIVVMGGTVLLIVLAIMLPILEMNTLVQ